MTIANHAIDIVQNLYSKTTIDIERRETQTTSGVRQGGPESPPLFNLYKCEFS